MELVLLLYTVCLLVATEVTGSADEDPIVDTPLGPVRGYRLTSRGGRVFLAFSGLPYAQPPVGQLRFEPPQPARPWSGIREAKEDGPLCLQSNIYQLNPSVRGVEDCLQLSLYTHNVSGKAPVMVHYHGGGYAAGNGARNTKPHFLMDEDIVLVNVNYRVGIVGLFHRAISESGSSYNLGSLMPKGYVRDVSLRLANMTNCSRSTSQEIVACLKSLPAQDLAGQIVKYREWQIDPVATFRVVFEEGPGAFLTWPIENWVHQPVPYLMGMTSGEGLIRTAYFVYYNMTWEWYTEHFNEVAPRSIGYFVSASEPQKVTNQIRQFYLPKNDITIEDWPKVVQMYTDSWYTAGMLNGADKHSGDVFFYYFDYLGEHTLVGNLNRSLVIGASHTDETIYLWNMTNYSNLKGQDLNLSKNLVKLWTNFAKYGNPTPKGSEFKWETWKSGHHRYLNISKDGFKMEEGLAEDRYRFWNQFSSV